MAVARPYRCAVPDSAIADLHQRIDRARWPDQIEPGDWAYGTELHVLRELVEFWRYSFDWRAAERSINQFDQSLMDIDGLDIHFIHQRSPHASARPLLMTHGWPGSIVEFLDVIPRLTHPERFGGDPADAFHVVCPSLPGYGFSPAAAAPGMHTGKVAERHARLMAELGYTGYIAQGGDWGSGISLQTATVDPTHCHAVHVNLMMMGAPKDVADPQASVTPAERILLDRAERHQREGAAYMHLQSTKPQSLAYAMQDSPVGLCAWIAEKFQSWSDCQGDLHDGVSWERLLANVSLYWYTGSIGSSMRLYRETAVAHQAGQIPRASTSVPLGVAVYPMDIYSAPRAWVERRMNLKHWYAADKGGHFAAMEQPQLFAEDLWKFKQAVA